MTSADVEKVIRCAQVLIFDVSFDGKILGFNENAAALFGAPNSSDVENISEVVTQQKKQFDDAFAKCMASKPPSDPVLVEATLRGCKGDIPLLLSLVRTDDSEVVRLLGLSLSPLEKKLVEETKSRLTSLVAQELRSPLNGMVGLTTALCKSPALSAPVKKQLGMLRSSSTRLLDLVTNVMDLGQKAPGASKVNFAELVEEVTVMTSLAVDRSNVPLLKPGVQLNNQLQEMDQIPFVLGDRDQFLHLLYNLVTNACKFTAAGSVTISANHLAESSELEICVKDTGCGISESGLAQILGAFKIDAGRPKQVQAFQGAGLGLAVCRDIAELHGGTLTAQSKEEQGSTFTAKFPCLSEFGPVKADLPDPGPAGRSATAQVPTQPVMAPRLQTAPAQAPAPKHRKPNPRPVILHVELDGRIQVLFKESFEDLYEVKGVGQIEDSLQKEDVDSPDILLLDLGAPLVLCHKVCTFVRQLPQPPALLLSADASDVRALQPLHEKFKDSVLPKPFNMQSLKKKLSEVLKEPIKTGVSLEQALVELMTIKSAILENQFQEALTSQVVGEQKTSKRSSTKSSTRSDVKSKLKELQNSGDRLEPGQLPEQMQRLQQEIALLRARDLRLAQQLQHQSCLNEAVLEESGTQSRSSSRFPVEKVHLSSLIDNVLAKVQAGKVAGMEAFASQGVQLQNGLKEASPVVIGNGRMIEQMILKLLMQSAKLQGPVSIIGKQMPNESVQVTLDWASPKGGASPNRSFVQSFSLQCLPGHGTRVKANHERPVLLAVDERNEPIFRSALGSDFELVCQRDGKAALEWLEQYKQDPPDLVLLDAEMSGITGYEVCRSIREMYSISELPVILLYDKSPSSAAALEGLDNGSNDFIVKPFDSQLKQKVSFNMGLSEVDVIQEVQKKRIRFLEMRVSEQAAQIGQLHDREKERHGNTEREGGIDLMPELDRWKLRSRQVAKRLMMQSQSLAGEVAVA